MVAKRRVSVSPWLISGIGLATTAMAIIVVRPMVQWLGVNGAGRVKAACESYRYHMHEHNELNPLLSAKAGALGEEHYRAWLLEGALLNQRLFEAVGVAGRARAASGDAQASLSSGIIDAASRCYMAGVDFGAFEEDKDYEEGIGSLSGSSGDSAALRAGSRRS